MAKLKTTQVKIQGLQTNPNPYALPPGSCAEAKNVLMRRPGMMTTLEEDRTLYTLNTLSSYKPFKAYNDQLYGGRFAVVQAQVGQSTIWNPADPETQVGGINTFIFNNRDYTPTLSSNAYEISNGWDYTGIYVEQHRNVGFIPGMTHAAYNTFRTLVTEKWGTIVSYERFAGLYPPMLQMELTQVPATSGTLDANNWFVPGNTVSYRAVLTLETSDTPDDPSGVLSPPPRPYILKGPPSQTYSLTQDLYGDKASVLISPALNLRDPLPKLAGFQDYKYFLEIYRCPQDEVQDPTFLTDDYRLVAKLAIPLWSSSTFPVAGGTWEWVDNISEDSRNGGQALYTNTGQEGDQGANYAPPSAADICVFKDSTFYANRAGLPAKSWEMRGAFGNLLTTSEVTYGIGHRTIEGFVNTGTNTISILFDPNDMTGLAVGQVISGSVWSSSFVTITSINTGTNTFTVSVIPSGPSTTVTMVVADRIDIVEVYADGTQSAVMHLDPTDPVGSAISWNLTVSKPYLYSWPQGLRFATGYGHVIDSYPPQQGYKFGIISTTPYCKRVARLVFQMTNHQNYAPQGKAITGGSVSSTAWVEGTYELRRNIVYVSKTGEPEHVPIGNFQVVGAGVILKMWPTTSAIFFFCSDGLWRLTGDGTTWTVDQIDPTAFLLHPDLVTSLNNKIYAMLEDGLSIVTDNGAQLISDDAIGATLRNQMSRMRAVQRESGKKTQLPYVFGPNMVADHHFNEVWWSLTTAGFTTDWDLIDSYIFNEDTQQFTRQTNFYRGMAYYARNQRVCYVKGTGIPDWTLDVKDDFFSEGDPVGGFPTYMQATVEFNPLVSEDQGNLKQWMDINYFMEANGHFYTLWNDEHRFVDENNLYRFETVHFWVPREYSLKPSLEDIGFTTDFNFTHFSLTGFTVRYRVASDTLKKQ